MDLDWFLFQTLTLEAALPCFLKSPMCLSELAAYSVSRKNTMLGHT